MNRELQFRVWYNSQMNYTPLISMSLFHFVNNKNQKKELNGIIMQYTGLNDKNNKRIFEGDVLQSRDEKMIISGKDDDYLNYDLHSFIYAVLYSEDHSGLGGRMRKDIEIIGNIYENPELI